MSTTTLLAFAPSPVAAPPFSAIVTLDGASYTLGAMWNFYSSRFYVSLTDQFGNLVTNQPLIGSPPSANVLLFPGLFTSTAVVYRVSTNNFEITTT